MNRTGIIVLIIVIILVVLGFFFYNNGGGRDTQEAPEGAVETQEFSAVIENIHTDQPLSPGVYVIHTTDASLNFEGSLSPESLEPLAEYGSNEAFASFVQTLDGVVEVITIDAPVLPGQADAFTFTVEGERLGELFLSGVQMLVGTNDAYALVDSLSLATVAEASEGIVVGGINYDNGTEENEEPGGGFEAGQPDPSQGEANIENGTPTDPQEPVTLYTQVTDTVLQFTVSTQ